MTPRMLVAAALALVAVRLALALFWSQLYAAFWVTLLIPLALIWLIGPALAVIGVMEATEHPGPVGERWLMALAMPIALVALWFGSAPATLLGYRLKAEWMLARDPRVVVAAQRIPPHAFSILQGVPDGGVSLIHAAIDPRRWTQGHAVRIVGERIQWCIIVRRPWYVCGYD